MYISVALVMTQRKLIVTCAGVCYTAAECSLLGGQGGGTCATGFGVCCTFSGACGGVSAVNNTYFSGSTSSDTSPCSFKVTQQYNRLYDPDHVSDVPELP